MNAQCQVSGAYDALDGNQFTIALRTDHFLVGGQHRFGDGAVVEQGDVAGHHGGAKPPFRGSSHQDAISGNQPGICCGPDKDGHAVVLDDQILIVPAEVGNRGFKGDRKRPAGLLIREGVNGAQRSQGSRCGCAGSRGPAENHHERYGRSLHRDFQTKWKCAIRPLRVLSVEFRQ